MQLTIVSLSSRQDILMATKTFKRLGDAYEVGAAALPLLKSIKSSGWYQLPFWPPMILSQCEIKFIKVVRIKSLETHSGDILWSLEQSVEEIKKINFSNQTDSNGQPFRNEYSIQLTAGSKVWNTFKVYEDIIALNEFIRQQNEAEASSVDILFKPLPSEPPVWKNYVEIHRHILSLESAIRAAWQNSSVLNQNAMDALCCFLEIPEHADADLIGYAHSAIETQSTALTKFRSLRTQDLSINGTPSAAAAAPAAVAAPAHTNANNQPPLPYEAVADASTARKQPLERPLSLNRDQFLTQRSSFKRDLYMDTAPEGSPEKMQVDALSKDPAINTADHKSVMKKTTDAPDYNQIYNKTPTSPTNLNLKYMPVEMVSTNKVKNSIAKGLLFEALSVGMPFIKHGRQGKPKKKILKCDALVTTLLWFPDNQQDNFSESKGLRISDIQSVRLGTDIDPETSEEALKAAGLSSPGKEPVSKGKKSVFGSLFSGDKNKIMYGTSVLRKSCSPEEMSLCLSLILPDRTFDMQCLSRKDFDFLSVYLKELIKPSTPAPVSVSPASSKPGSKTDIDRFDENPLKSSFKKAVSIKKSVRFGEEESSPSDVPLNEANGSPQSGRPLQALNPVHRTASYDITSTQHVITVASDGNLDVLLEGKPASNSIGNSYLNMSSTEALQIGLILSEQESLYGTNMYESLKPPDEALIAQYVLSGMTTEEAILRIFEEKYVPSDQRKFGSVDSGDAQPIRDEDFFGKQKPKEAPGLTPQGQSLGRKSSFFPQLGKSDDSADASVRVVGGALKDHISSPTGKKLLKIKSSDALRVGLLLSQQEDEYGTNMYNVLLPEDEPELNRLIDTGLTTDQAALEIFKKKNIPKKSKSFGRGRQPAASFTKPKTVTAPPTTLQAEPVHHASDDRVASNASMASSITDIPSPSASRTNSTLERKPSSTFFPNSKTVIPGSHDVNKPSTTSSSTTAASTSTPQKQQNMTRLTSAEAMHLAMLLSEQEAQYGINMYDSLQASDEPEIQRYMAQGFSMEEAVYAIFDRKFVHASPV